MAHASRRTFAKTIAAASAAIPLLRTDLGAQTPHPVDQLKPAPLAEALTEVVRAESGRHLTSQELDVIENGFARHVKALAALREYKLTSSDEPDFTFVAGAKRS